MGICVQDYIESTASKTEQLLICALFVIHRYNIGSCPFIVHINGYSTRSPSRACLILYHYVLYIVHIVGAKCTTYTCVYLNRVDLSLSLCLSLCPIPLSLTHSRSRALDNGNNERFIYLPRVKAKAKALSRTVRYGTLLCAIRIAPALVCIEPFLRLYTWLAG